MIDLSLKSLAEQATLCSEKECMKMLKNYLGGDVLFDDGDLSSELRNLGNNRWTLTECKFLSRQFFIHDLLDAEKCEKVFYYFFIHDGMQIHVRREKLTEYADVERYCHPFVFIAAHLAAQMERGNISENMCEDISHNVLESALPHIHRASYAENHCHFNGAKNNNAILIKCLTSDTFMEILQKRGKKKNPKIDRYLTHLLVFITSFSFLNQSLISADNSSTSLQKFQAIFKAFGDKLPPDLSCEAISDFSSLLFSDQFYPLDLSQLSKLFQDHLLGSCFPLLLCTALRQYEKHHYNSAMLLFLTAFFRFIFHPDKNADQIRKPFLLFIQELNILWSKLVMSGGAGLADFVQVFNGPLRRIEQDFGNVSRSIFMSGTTFCEFRMGILPEGKIVNSICSEIKRTLDNYYPMLNAFVDDKYRVCSQDKILFNFGYHFSKSAGKNDPLRSYDRKADEVRTNKILPFFTEEKNRWRMDTQSESFPLGEDKKNIYYDLRLALRTIDAAGDENLFPPEVFAPFARKLREEMFCKVNCSDPIFSHSNLRQLKRIRFAFHAGEDFTHIVTGMRRVYETIFFLDYERNDRLGHALAIGLNPMEWIKEKKELLLSYEEYFDNCVWLHKMAVEISQKRHEFGMWADFYERKIRELQKVLCINPELSVQQLFEAYEKRKNMWDYPNCSDKGDYKNDERIVLFARDYKNRHSCHDEKNKIEIYSESDSGNGKCLWFEPLHVVFDDRKSISSEKLFLPQQTVQEAEVDFWEAVQDYLLQICTDKGIILEANPSSNLAISNIRRYDDHPIFRWIPLMDEDIEDKGRYNRFGIRHGRVRACINSDDPGIFSTTLQNEFFFLEETAKVYAPAEKVRNWIRFLREEGTEIFLDNYISPFFIEE